MSGRGSLGSVIRLHAFISNETHYLFKPLLRLPSCALRRDRDGVRTGPRRTRVTNGPA